MPEPTTVLLVDDHPFIREGVRSFLSDFPEFKVVGEAENAEDALTFIQQSPPDMVLMDLNLPKMSGFKATEIIRSSFPNIKVVVVTVHDSREYVLRLAETGVHGYILKGAPPSELLEALRNVVTGHRFFSAKVSGYLADHLNHQKNDGLTDREIEVLICATQGLSMKETAEKLNIAQWTVQTYRTRVMEKLNIHTLAGLIKYAISKGYISLEQ